MSDEETQNAQQQISLEDLQEFEVGKGIDVSEYEGQRTEIEKVEIVDMTTNYNEEGKFIEGLARPTKRLKVSTKVITTIETQEGEKVEIRGSELFALKESDGHWGVSDSPKSNINKLLKKLKLPVGLEGVKQLVGKQVVLRLRGDDNNYLGFIY